MNESNLRKNLEQFLKENLAHITIKNALANLKLENRNKKPHTEMSSIWEELEHIRLAQEDILQYTINPDWKSPKWPDNYWPDPVNNLSDKTWRQTVDGFFNDLDEVIKIINNKSLDLTSVIPHTKEHTYLREILLIIDHNAYHLGKIVMIRKMLGDW